jgi:hypothetical protein
VRIKHPLNGAPIAYRSPHNLENGMTNGTSIPRGHALADVLDAALALGTLDDAVRDVQAVAAWGAQELESLRADKATDAEAVLLMVDSIVSSLTTAANALGRANGLLGGVSRRVLRDLDAGGDVLRRLIEAQGREKP